MYDDGMPSSDWFSDTDPRALHVWIEILRRMTPAEKVEAVSRVSQDLVRVQEAAVRRLYPEAGDREIFLRTLARRLRRDLVIRAYGWDPAGDRR
jgi:hypothetical protein